jgi:hypothetical protein
MNLNLFINKIFKIVLSPQIKWAKYNFNNKDYKKELRISLIISLSIVFIIRLFGTTMSYLSSSSIVYIILCSLICSVVDILYFVSITFILYKILPYYEIDFSKAKVGILIFATLIPFYFSLIIINLFPSLFFVSIVSVYSLYILYWGIKNYLKLSKKHDVIFFIITVILLIGLYMMLYLAVVFPFFDFITIY